MRCIRVTCLESLYLVCGGTKSHKVIGLSYTSSMALPLQFCSSKPFLLKYKKIKNCVIILNPRAASCSDIYEHETETKSLDLVPFLPTELILKFKNIQMYAFRTTTLVHKI